jgi:hypothetical protein
MSTARDPAFFSKTRYFKYSSYLWSYLAGKSENFKFDQVKTNMNDILTALKGIFMRENLYDLRNASIVVADYSLELALNVKSLHLTQLSDYVVKQLSDLEDPAFYTFRGSAATRMIRHPGEVHLRRFHPYHPEKREERMRKVHEWKRAPDQPEVELCEEEPRLDVKTFWEIKRWEGKRDEQPEILQSPPRMVAALMGDQDERGKAAPGSGLKPIMIQEEMMRLYPHTRCRLSLGLVKALSITDGAQFIPSKPEQTYSWDDVTKGLSKFLLTRKDHYFDDRNVSLCNVPPGDPLEAAVECNHFHRSQVGSLLRENIVDAHNFFIVRLHASQFSK